MGLNLIFVIITCAFTHYAYSEGDNDYYWGTAIFYIIMLIETAFSRTRTYLTHVEHTSKVQSIIDEIKAKPPKVFFYIQCYHFELRTRVRTRNGRTRVETYNERVNTHTAKEPFRFVEWVD